MNTVARVVWCLLFALVHELVVYAAFIVPGFLIVPVAILTARRRPSIDGSREILTAPAILWPWGNEEDGFDPEWWEVQWLTWPTWWRRWVWAAWRNPANNLRFIRAIYAPPQVGKVQVRDFGNGWLLLWQGWRHRIIAPGYRLTVGFKYEPRDATTPCTDWRRFGCGFGIRKA